jgi:protein AaeX
MLREISLFGALAPSLLLYFLASIALFLVIDRVASLLGFYRLVWHPPLVRFAFFVCLFTALVLLTNY